MSVRDVDELAAALRLLEHRFASTELSNSTVDGFDAFRSGEIGLDGAPLVCSCPPLVLSICSLDSCVASTIHRDICARAMMMMTTKGSEDGNRFTQTQDVWPNDSSIHDRAHNSSALLLVLTNGRNATFARVVFPEELLGIESSLSGAGAAAGAGGGHEADAAVKRCQTRFPVHSPALKPSGAEWSQFIRSLFSAVHGASASSTGISVRIEEGDVRSGTGYGGLYERMQESQTQDESRTASHPLLCPLHDHDSSITDERLVGAVAMMRFTSVTWEVPLLFYPSSSTSSSHNSHSAIALWLSRTSRSSSSEMCARLQAEESLVAQLRSEVERLRAGMQGGGGTSSDVILNPLSAMRNVLGDGASATVVAPDSERKPSNLLNPQQRGATKRPRGMKIQ